MGNTPEGCSNDVSGVWLWVISLPLDFSVLPDLSPSSLYYFKIIKQSYFHFDLKKKRNINYNSAFERQKRIHTHTQLSICTQVLFKLSAEITLFIIRNRAEDVILAKTQQWAGDQSGPGSQAGPWGVGCSMSGTSNVGSGGWTAGWGAVPVLSGMEAWSVLRSFFKTMLPNWRTAETIRSMAKGRQREWSPMASDPARILNQQVET